MANLLEGGITQARSPQFQPSSASSTFFNEVSRSYQNIANEMQNKAENLYISSSLTDARKSAREIYQKNLDNPDQLQKELAKYQEGMLSKVPSNLAPRLQNEYSQLSEQYISKAITVKNEQLTLEQQKGLEEYENQILNDIQFSARELFGGNQKLNEDEIKVKNLNAINNIAANFDALDKEIGAVGANGKPLKTPQQVVKSINKAKEYFFSETARTWLGSQQDKLAAYHKWKNNEVVLDLPEGSINVRDAMTPEVRDKIDKELMQNIKNEIYVRKQRTEEVEKEQEAFKDEVKKILFDKRITGDLSPAQVEASRNILDYNDYKEFSQMAKEANPITNGSVYGKLLNDIDAGKDIEQELQVERFVNKSLSNEDYKQLKDRLQGKEAITDPETNNIRLMRGLLGGDSELLDLAGSATMARAELELRNAYLNFKEGQGRRPDEKEAQEIMENVVERYAIMNLDNYSAAIPKPSQMPLSIKTKSSQLTDENLQKVKEDTINFYSTKYEGDLEKVKEDPKFIEDMKSIKKFERVLLLKKEKAQQIKK